MLLPCIAGNERYVAAPIKQANCFLGMGVIEIENIEIGLDDHLPLSPIRRAGRSSGFMENHVSLSEGRGAINNYYQRS